MPSLVTLTPAPAPQTPALDPRDLPGVTIPGLYVHVPFCFHKCHYCDFYSITRQTPERMTRFVDLTLRELDHWLAAGSQLLRPRTIFFGGGTPSLLPFEHMDRLLGGLRDRLDLTALLEWTIEVNPATTSLDYLQMLRGHGVDRISMGAQSFHTDELRTLERHHGPADVLRSVELCRAAGFARVNIDLIYAIPGQTLASWADSLEQAIALGLDHYSCYNLTYEPNTPMAVKQRLGRLTTIEESIELQMLRLARSRLASVGCPPYEISNYAAAGQACRHNLLYWTGGSYLGIGPSAASHVEGVRFKNRPHLGEWERAIESGTLPAIDVERLSPRQRAGEHVMLGLRLAEGVRLDRFDHAFGRSLQEVYARTIDHLLQIGMVTLDERSLRLTDRGIDVADAVAAEFLAADEG